jgi:hypothetical protein
MAARSYGSGDPWARYPWARYPWAGCPWVVDARVWGAGIWGARIWGARIWRDWDVGAGCPQALMLARRRSLRVFGAGV